MTDTEILKELKYRLDLRFDTQLAGLLGVTKQAIADVRAGRRRLPVTARFIAWDKLGYAYTRDSVLWMLGEAGERLIEADNARARARADEAARRGGEEHGAADDEWT